MRFARGFAIALVLSLPVAGVISSHQDPAGENTGGQAPAAPANPQTPAAQPKAPGAKKKTDASSENRIKKRKRTDTAPNGGPRKIVVREGGANEPAAQIVPGMTPAETTRQRQNAEQWLQSTDDQLKLLAGRTLDAQRQETVGQIHNYLDGARTALKEGDVRRASTLAQKAYLLADDLVKH